MKVKSHKHAKTYAEAAIHVVAEELRKIPSNADIVKQAWAISGETYKKALDLINVSGSIKEIEDLINLADRQADEAREIAVESLVSAPVKDMEGTFNTKRLMLYVGIGAVGLAVLLMVALTMKKTKKLVTANPYKIEASYKSYNPVFNKELEQLIGRPCAFLASGFGRTDLIWHFNDRISAEIAKRKLMRVVVSVTGVSFV